MPSTLMTLSSDDVALQKIASLIDDAKDGLALTVNSAMTVLYWDIGRAITEDLLKGEKPEYGDSSIASLANSSRAEYGKAFDRANLFQAIQFHQQFLEKRKSFRCHDNCLGPTYWLFCLSKTRSNANSTQRSA